MKIKKSYIGVAAGVLYAFVSLATAAGIITRTGATGTFPLITLTGTVVTAVCLLLRKRNTLLTAGYALLAFSSLYNLISGFFTQRYSVYISHYKEDTEYIFNVFTVIPWLLEAIAAVGMLILALTALTGCMPCLYRLSHRLWFVPAVCMASAMFIVTAIVVLYEYDVFTGYWQTGIAYITSFGIIKRLASVAAVLLAALWLTGPDRK